MSMIADLGGQQMEIRYVDKTMYIKMPPGMPGTGPSKQWMKISPGGKDQLSQMLGNLEQLADQNDPSTVLTQIEQAGTVTASEPTELNAQPATRYAIDLQLAKLAEQSAGGMSGESLKQLQQAGVTSLPMELWLNEGNLPVQIRLDMTKALAAAGQQQGGNPPQGKAMMTTKFADWGAHVDVKAPPAEQVAEPPK
ncbi:MAG: hypothetical protein ACRDQ7_06560 [Haloechinothrix sp.]